jgi:hypothetical protein
VKLSRDIYFASNCNGMKNDAVVRKARYTTRGVSWFSAVQLLKRQWGRNVVGSF